MADFGGIKDQVAVVGVGNTEFGRQLNRASLDLIAEAMQKALDDCGLRKDDIDGLCSNFGWPASTDLDSVAEVLGLNINWYGQTWSHGRFCAGSIQWASFAVHHGLADYVACIIGQGRGRRMVGGAGDAEGTRETGGGHGESPHYGMTSPGSGAALAARRYFHKYGAGSEDLAAVPIAFRKHASLNPGAIMQKVITMEDYLNSRLVCEPLHLFDYSLVNDGGVCLIVTTAERARDLKKPPVYISGMEGIKAGRHEFIFGRQGLGIQQQDEFEPKVSPGDLRVFNMAGVGPEDIGAFYTYDAFSVLAWFALERFGFCGPGEAAAFCRDGQIELGGRLPMNTNGGLLSEGHMNGWGHQAEIVRQLRGECGERQVQGIQLAMWGNSYGDALIYRR
jgi:acetyl-CoA acetyltransferase